MESPEEADGCKLAEEFGEERLQIRTVPFGFAWERLRDLQRLWFPINPDSYGALVRRVGKKAGIEKIHPHMFRHTFVSILLSNPNIGVATVAAEAGHAQPSTTLAIYTQVYDRRRDEIRKQMSRELYK